MKNKIKADEYRDKVTIVNEENPYNKYLKKIKNNSIYGKLNKKKEG